MAIYEERVDSLIDFISVVKRLRNRWRRTDLWFRGQKRASWDLSPRAYRPESDEAEVRTEFERLGRQLITEPTPGTHWEWYFLMQHYGAPTRLLDWTDGALLALYFAVRPEYETGSSRKDRFDAAVWALEPIWLNEKKDVLHAQMIALSNTEEVQDWLPEKPLDEDSNVKKKFPAAIDPPHIARRVAVQRSHFTIFGTLKAGLTRIGRSDPKARLAKVTISRRGLAAIRSDLKSCGIHETTIFPDLEGLSRELKDELAL